MVAFSDHHAKETLQAVVLCDFDEHDHFRPLSHRRRSRATEDDDDDDDETLSSPSVPNCLLPTRERRFARSNAGVFNLERCEGYSWCAGKSKRKLLKSTESEEVDFCASRRRARRKGTAAPGRTRREWVYDTAIAKRDWCTFLYRF